MAYHTALLSRQNAKRFPRDWRRLLPRERRVMTADEQERAFRIWFARTSGRQPEGK